MLPALQTLHTVYLDNYILGAVLRNYQLELSSPMILFWWCKIWICCPKKLTHFLFPSCTLSIWGPVVIIISSCCHDYLSFGQNVMAPSELQSLAIFEFCYLKRPLPLYQDFWKQAHLLYSYHITDFFNVRIIPHWYICSVVWENALPHFFFTLVKYSFNAVFTIWNWWNGQFWEPL